MTATAVPRGDAAPGSVPEDTLTALRQECETLRAQLGDAQIRLEKLHLQLQHLEQAHRAPPAVESSVPTVHKEELLPLPELIDALVRGLDREPRSSSGLHRRPGEGDWGARLVRRLPWPWVAATVLLFAVVLFLWYLR